MSQESPEQREEPSPEDGALGVGDDQLPEDLRPAEDNPLAQPAGDDVPDDILLEGAGHADSGGDSEDASPSGDGDASDASSSAASSEAVPEGGSGEPGANTPTTEDEPRS